jgi:hypothetical protein
MLTKLLSSWLVSAAENHHKMKWRGLKAAEEADAALSDGIVTPSTRGRRAKPLRPQCVTSKR